MKYSVEISINKPLNLVIELFDNPENMLEWMPGLEKYEHLHGKPGEVGSTMRLIFSENKRRIEMVETITARNLPEVFSAEYESNMAKSTVTASFEELPGNHTRYITEQEYKLSGIMKFIGPLMKGAFKKQSMKYLQGFKDFAEKN